MRKAHSGAAAYVASDDNALINNALVVGVTAPAEIYCGDARAARFGAGLLASKKLSRGPRRKLAKLSLALAH